MSARVVVTLTEAQAQVLHETLSMVTADPDWADMLGGGRQLQTLARAHTALLQARDEAGS